jgi:YgiT-type zinc finger domain-containing protein
MRNETEDHLEERLVTFSVEYHGRLVIIENVPARIDPETGERFFSPDTVERLQAIVWSGRESDHIAQTPVFQFAA